MCYSNHRYCKEYGRLSLASITNVLLSDVLSILLPCTIYMTN